MDESIAQGLADEVNNEKEDAGSDEGAFVSHRSRKQAPNILPPSAFFAPKKPPQTAGVGSPGSALAGLPTANLFDQHKQDIQIDSEPALGGRGEPEPLDTNGRKAYATRSRLDDGDTRRPHSPFGFTSSSSSDGAGHAPHNAAGQMIGLDSAEANRFGAHHGTARSRDGLLGPEKQSTVDMKSSETQAKSASTLRGEERRNIKSLRSGERKSDHEDFHMKGDVEGLQRQRNYKLHKGANKFFLCGTVMTADGNPLPFLASFVFMIGIPVLWIIFVAPFTWTHVNPAPVIIFAYVWLVAATSMV